MSVKTFKFSGRAQEKISLAAEIKKISNKEFQNAISLHVIIEKKSNIIIKDDLISIGVHACNISVELQQDAQLFLETQFLCPSLVDSKKCGCCHIPTDAHQHVVRHLIFNLVQPGARIKTCIRFAGGKNRMFDLSVKHNHKAANTHSTISAKSVLDENAQLTCSMLTTATQEAKNSTTVQENKNLVLGKNVKINTAPNLIINTNVIKCLHSSSTGSVDANMMFYLESRGIAERQSREALINAYLK